MPAWSEAFALDAITRVTGLPLGEPARAWAFDGATGRGVKVAVLDSGIDGTHPLVGEVHGAVAVEAITEPPDTQPGGEPRPGVRFVVGPHEDLVGHGTACAGIIRSLAPEAEIYSVRVLGANLKGRGSLFHAGLQWAIDAGMDVLNLSLSSKSDQWYAALHQVADRAYFAGTVMVCAANNMPGPTYPSQYASVVSVAARPGVDAESLTYNVHPPVEFGARGIDIEVPWTGGVTITATGNSFATPHVAGMVARILSKHPGLTPFQVKTVLHAVCTNAVSA
jgi:subtilisin family serine protease